VRGAGYGGRGGRWVAVAGLVGWGGGEWMVVDNVVYVGLAGDRMRMHPVPAMVAFLGGLAVFGMSGMILGPAIVAVTGALIDVWKRPGADSDRVPAPAAPAPAGAGA